MYKRILLAYDGSVKGRAALREGALMALRLHAEVFLLSVIAEAPGTRLADGAGGTGVTQQQEDYRAVLKDGVARLTQLGFKPVAKLVVGDPAEQIGAFAEQIHADLVVVGHHRQSAFGRWWSGTSGAYLIDHIHCSMLISQNVISDEEFAAVLPSRGSARLPESAAAATEQAAAEDPAQAQAQAQLQAQAPAQAAQAQSAAEPGVTAQPRAAASAPVLAEAQRAAPGPPLRSRRLRWALYLLLALVLLGAALWYVLGGAVVSMSDAYVEANKVGISTDVAGIVKEVAVKENQRVASGQILYRLDDQPFRFALQRADAQLGMVRDSLNALKASYRDAQAQLAQARNDAAYYVTEFRRTQDLLGVRVASQAAFDTARRNLQNSRQKLLSLEEQLAGVRANLNGNPAEPVERDPRYLEALAQRDEAARELAHTIVRAPFAGIVTDVPDIAPGRYLPVMATAFYLVATDHVWVDANPKETTLTYVRPGQPATVTVDTYPGLEWRGSVESISPAAAQEFSLLPAQNTSGNWVKVVQRIPLRIRVDTDSNLPPLRAGMSVEVAVDTGHRRGLPHFFSTAAAAPARKH